MKKALIILLYITTTIQAAQIDDQTQKPSAWENEMPNILSPVTTPAIWILGAGSLLTYAVYRAKKDQGDIGYDENHSEKVNGDWRFWGNVLGWGALQAGYTLTQLSGIRNGDKRALENTEIMWKSTIYTALTTFALKLTVREQRRNGEVKYDSFPSGHASSAFAFATNVALRHEWYWNLITVPLALFVTTARIDDDSHYVHDSIFGAALGMSFAYGMNYISGDVSYLFGFEPVEDGGTLIFKYKF